MRQEDQEFKTSLGNLRITCPKERKGKYRKEKREKGKKEGEREKAGEREEGREKVGRKEGRKL